MARVDYDRMAPDYLEGRALPPAGMAPWRDEIARWLPEDPAGRSPMLDLGAGTGQFAAAIAGWFGVEVIAVEPSQGMRAQAVRANSHPDVHWVAGVGERLPLRTGTCAMAWVSTVVHHLDDAAVAELGRVLRPGAPMLVRQAFSRPHQVAVGGWPDQGLGLVGEADQAHPQVGRDLVEQVHGRLLDRLEPGGGRRRRPGCCRGRRPRAPAPWPGRPARRRRSGAPRPGRCRRRPGQRQSRARRRPVPGREPRNNGSRQAVARAERSWSRATSARARMKAGEVFISSIR
jgi:SAM-dependent methyltransferase